MSRKIPTYQLTDHLCRSTLRDWSRAAANQQWADWRRECDLPLRIVRTRWRRNESEHHLLVPSDSSWWPYLRDDVFCGRSVARVRATWLATTAIALRSFRVVAIRAGDYDQTTRF